MSQNPQKRAAHHRATTKTSDTKAQTQRDSRSRRLPTTNTETGLMDCWPILGKRPRTAARTRTSGNIVAAILTTPLWRREKIGSRTDQDPSVLEVPTMNWSKYVGVKSVHYKNMCHAFLVNAEEPNNWDLGSAVRETERNFFRDFQISMTETTIDPHLLKTLVCLERRTTGQHTGRIQYLP